MNDLFSLYPSSRKNASELSAFFISVPTGECLLVLWRELGTFEWGSIGKIIDEMEKVLV